MKRHSLPDSSVLVSANREENEIRVNVTAVRENMLLTVRTSDGKALLQEKINAVPSKSVTVPFSFPENEPLKRRENKEFSKWFEILWRELNV